MNDPANETSLRARDHGLSLHSPEDALEVIYGALDGCLFEPTDLAEDFFDLKTGLAGDVFQKFVNYGFRAAFVVPEDHPYGPRTDELIRDHRNHPNVRFFAREAEAERWLQGSRGSG